MTIGNDGKLPIIQTSSTHFLSSQKPLALRNVSHVPLIFEKLSSINKLCKDNEVFVEIYGDYIFIKDIHLKMVLLQGLARNGLYKFTPTTASISGSHVALLIQCFVLHDQLVHVFDLVLNKALTSQGIS